MVYDLRKRQIKGEGAKCNFPPLDMGGKLGEAGRGGAGRGGAGRGGAALLHFKPCS